LYVKVGFSRYVFTLSGTSFLSVVVVDDLRLSVVFFKQETEFELGQ